MISARRLLLLRLLSKASCLSQDSVTQQWWEHTLEKWHWYQLKGTMGKWPLTQVLSKSPVNSCRWVGPLVSRNLPLCMFSLSSSVTYCSWKFESQICLPLVSVFDTLQSFCSSSDLCWCVDLSGAEGRPPLPHLISALLFYYPGRAFRIVWPVFCFLNIHFLSVLRNIMAWTPD